MILDRPSCQLCGEVSELRPVGPNGENICVTCGLKDFWNMQARLHGWLLKEGVIEAPKPRKTRYDP